MPTLRSWNVHHPRDWTPRQREEYLQDATGLLAISMGQVADFAGVQNGVNMMFAVLKMLLAAHPQVIDATLDVALDWCADVAKIPHDTEGRVVN